MSYPFEHFEEGGHKYVRRPEGAEVCDFCLAKLAGAIAWTYPCAPLMLDGPAGAPITGSDDDFAVCQDCHECVERNDPPALVERMVMLQPVNEPPSAIIRYPPEADRRRYAWMNVMRFMDARRGLPHLDRQVPG